MNVLSTTLSYLFLGWKPRVTQTEVKLGLQKLWDSGERQRTKVNKYDSLPNYWTTATLTSLWMALCCAYACSPLPFPIFSDCSMEIRQVQPIPHLRPSCILYEKFMIRSPNFSYWSSFISLSERKWCSPARPSLVDRWSILGALFPDGVYFWYSF